MFMFMLKQKNRKIVPKFSPEIQKKGNFLAPEIFHFLEQDLLLFARVEIAMTEFPTKTAEKE